MLRVVLADDQASIRRALSVLLNVAPDIQVVGTASSGPEAVSLSRQLHPDVVAMDVRMPRGDGIEAARELAAADPPIPTVLMTAFDTDDTLSRALEAGVSGYVLKLPDPGEIVRAVRAAARGEMVISAAVTRRALTLRPDERADGHPGADPRLLTAREIEIVRGLCAGSSTNEAVADRLGVSEATVRSHLRRIMRKLGVESRAELVAWAFRSGVVA